MFRGSTILFAFLMGFAVWCYVSIPHSNHDQIGNGFLLKENGMSFPATVEDNVIHRKLFGCCGCQNAGRACVYCCSTTGAKNGTV